MSQTKRNINMKVLEPNIDKICDGIFIAKTLVYKDKREIAVSMQGKTAEIAK